MTVAEFALYPAAEGEADGIRGSIWLDPSPLCVGSPFRGRLDLEMGEPRKVQEVRLELRVKAEATVSGGRDETITVWVGQLAGEGEFGGGAQSFEFASQLPEMWLPTLETEHGHSDAQFHVDHRDRLGARSAPGPRRGDLLDDGDVGRARPRAWPPGSVRSRRSLAAASAAATRAGAVPPMTSHEASAPSIEAAARSSSPIPGSSASAAPSDRRCRQRRRDHRVRDLVEPEPRLLGLGDERADDVVGDPERHAAPDEGVGDGGRGRVALVGRGPHPLAVDGQRLEQPGHHAQRRLEDRDRVEQRRLVSPGGRAGRRAGGP